MVRRAVSKTGKPRHAESHGSDDERIRRLTLVALECRVDSHDWPRGQAIEYVHLENFPDGSVKLGERRKTCRTCGLIRYEIYSFPYPDGPAQLVSGPRYRYYEVDYLIKADPDHPDLPRPTREDFRAELWARTRPWSNAAPAAAASRRNRR